MIVLKLVKIRVETILITEAIFWYQEKVAVTLL